MKKPLVKIPDLNPNTFGTGIFVEFTSENFHVPGQKPIPRPADRPRIAYTDDEMPTPKQARNGSSRKKGKSSKKK